MTPSASPSNEFEGDTESREIEALALFATHGVLDAGTTVAAALTVGIRHEANPLMRMLLSEGIGFAVGSMLFTVGLLAAAWPHMADRYDLPRWFIGTLVVVGLLVAAGNVAVVLAGWFG